MESQAATTSGYASRRYSTLPEAENWAGITELETQQGLEQETKTDMPAPCILQLRLAAGETTRHCASGAQMAYLPRHYAATANIFDA